MIYGHVRVYLETIAQGNALPVITLSLEYKKARHWVAIDTASEAATRPC